MKTARKLRVVESCPQPDPPPYKPIQYGFAGGHKIERLPSMPTAEEISIRARAQSILSKGGTRAELPDIETARRVIAEQSMPARAATAHDSPPWRRCGLASQTPPCVDPSPMSGTTENNAGRFLSRGIEP